MHFYPPHEPSYSVPTGGFALDGRRLEILLRNLSGIVVFCVVVCGTGHALSRLIEQTTLLSNERQEDREVLRMCAEARLASDSARMRSMCLQARADTSTPLVLAAILKTCRLLTVDFCDILPSMYSPHAFMILCTIIPWLLPLVRMCYSPPTRIVVGEGGQQHHVTFVVPTEWNAPRDTVWNGWTSPKAPPLLRLDCETAHDKVD